MNKITRAREFAFGQWWDEELQAHDVLGTIAVGVGAIHPEDLDRHLTPQMVGHLVEKATGKENWSAQFGDLTIEGPWHALPSAVESRPFYMDAVFEQIVSGLGLEVEFE